MKDLDQSDYEADGERMNAELSLDEEDTSLFVRNADLAKAVRAHLKMAKWVRVKIEDPFEADEAGKWSIRTTDIAARGQWYVDGRNPDGTPHIDIMMEEYSQVPEPTVLPDAQLVRPATEIDWGADDPSDDDVDNIQNRVADVERQWSGIKTFIHKSLELGDSENCKEARDLIPGLFVNVANLLSALDTAIVRAEQQEEYENRN
jgi:hypothetical protein